MKLSGGLALMLIIFGGLYGGFGPSLSVARGPAHSSFEAVRRYDTAQSHGAIGLASSLGEASLAMARQDSRWPASDLADLARRVAESDRAAGHIADALNAARIAGASLDTVAEPDKQLLIGVAEAHGDIALMSGNKLEAACSYGLLLERVGPDRVAHPEARLWPHPVLAELTKHLDAIGPRFAAGSPQAASGEGSPPLTSCHLLADFYAERNNYAAASEISDLVMGKLMAATIDPEIRAALLQDAAHISELDGNVAAAKTRLTQAVDALGGNGQKPALVVALEALATIHANWSDAKGAEPILERAIGLAQQLYGPDYPSLVSPLVALGYAQLDSGKTQEAEATLNRALGIAESESARNPSAALEPMLALSELYQDQQRKAEADALNARMAALQKAGATLKPADVEDVPILVPKAASRLAVFDIPFRSREASGRITAALAAPASAEWTKQWPDKTFVKASESFAQPMVYAPKLTRAGDADPTIGATLVFVPGQGTDLAAAAARLARLQGLIGPGELPVIVDWTDDTRLADGLRDDAAEHAGERALETVLAGIPASQQGVTLIAEGRGAYILASALANLTARERQAVDARLKHLILIAPDVPEATLRTWLAGPDGKSVQTLVYPSANARPLLIAKTIYGADPIGLDATRVAALGVETVDTSRGTDWLDFDQVASSALIADMASVISAGAPAAKRCGLVHERGAMANLFALDPSGCALPPTN